MRELLIVLTLALLLAGCGQREMEKPPEEGPPSLALPEGASITSATLRGEALSPDGRFLAVERGRGEPVPSEGVYPAQVSPADTVQITDAETGEVLWEDFGAYGQSILWSPEGGFAALARTARTWCSVTVIETENWTSWEFTLPDGSPIPEYTFLPENWGAWQSEGSLDLTIGRGGDAGEQHFYQCRVWTNSGGVTGESREMTLETLGSWDFTHDSRTETVELETVWFPGETGTARDYSTLRILDREEVLWEDTAAVQHAGENSLYALRLDGADYLLQYVPSMGQGYGSYQYRIFSLDSGGEPLIYKENHVEFDINFGSPIHERFDIPEIAAFLREVHGYLDQAQELVNTIWDEIDLGNVDYSAAAALEKALEGYRKEMTVTTE